MRLARKLIVAAAVLGGLFLAANIVAERVAESRIASEAQKSFGTDKPPAVSLGGFPLLLNILQGTIPSASIEGEDLQVQDLHVARFRVELEGVHASISDVTAGKPIRIDKGLGEASVTSKDITAYVRSRGHDVDVAIRPGGVRVTGKVAGAGTGVAEGTPKLVGRLLRFEPDRVSVGGKPLSGAALAAAKRELTFEVDVPPLPFGVRITAIEYREGEASLLARLEKATIDLSKGP